MKLLEAMIVELEKSNLTSIALTKSEGEWDLQVPVSVPSWNPVRPKKIIHWPAESLGPLGPVEHQLIDAIKEVKLESNIVLEDESSIYDLVIEGVQLSINPRSRGSDFMTRPIVKLNKGNFLSVFNGPNWDKVFTPREIRAIGKKFGFEIAITHIYSNRAKHVAKYSEQYEEK